MSERWYRLGTAGLLVTALGVSGALRRRADTGEAVGRRAQGASLWVLRGAVLGVAGLVLGYLVVPTRVAWARVDLPRSVRWAGGLLATACLPLLYWVFATLGRNVSPTANVRAEATLVTDGPYRYVRHPLYTVATAFWLGLCLLSGLWAVALALALGVSVIVRRTEEEERQLTDRFGEAYSEYCERTGRFLPRVSR
ncbi:methyltransferase family protein [Halogeometricum limi]|uniref:Protein-S-isoprenylcysteine O-methyltransferase Ste14 n=1 Tax=Halogeometricum limi TaxID=555875 RepID=A0A1I6H8Q2_9EURY|nr:isoprenylcysteine carboxylmethyltransferase family protein [Halogeometricum limi]SFR50760.1 Protein-S-isoprenylcysteine O-methyltransferase Ste14 [Halogeometricum limi]